ncbi:hypothetical protein N431DRAFT_501365 [Stipitochalara longipes BDJ]|nr:hypothetical protein N431DRAFT_501365 [Stipitochalara longipes BDJ]
MLSRHGKKQPPHSIQREDEMCGYWQNENQYQRSVSLKYSRLSQDFHVSVSAPCRWCQGLMSGILTAAHLDYWYDHWNGSHSDGSCMDVDQDDVEVDGLETDGPESDSESGSAKDDDQSSREWTLIEVTFIQENSLDGYAMMEVALDLSWHSHETEGGDLLPNLKAYKAVHLIFEVFSEPEPKQSRLFPSLPGADNLASDHHLQGPRLVIHSSLLQKVKYVALSYVWGMNQTYVLAKATLEEKCSRLDLSRLPKTIINAIEDAGADMKDEIAVMGTIYRDSAVTIIAANASSLIEGFLRLTESPNFFVDLFSIPVMTGCGTVEHLSVGYRSYYKPFKDPINSRAWTLQERILSTRNLIYESKGMVSNDGLRQAWLDIRNEYTSRKLTYGRDKLAVIFAIAFEVAKESGWTYLAGLWKEHLFLDLQWHRDPQSTMLRPGKDKPANPLYPWASMDGPAVDPNEGGDPRAEFHFRILSCDVEYMNIATPAKFHFEPVRCGILVVEARMIELDWRWADPGDLTGTFLLDPGQGITYICGEANFDAEEPDFKPEETKNHKRLPVEGLLILRATEPETFRRIGFFKIYSIAMFDGVSDRIIRII